MRNLFLSLVFISISLFLSGCVTTGFDTLQLDTQKQEKLEAIKMDAEKKEFAINAPVYIRIFKEEGILEFWMKQKHKPQYALYKSYPICKFSGVLGPKLFEGDEQAPEGFYAVGPGQLNPRSQYYLSFNVGYPNVYDQAYGRTGSLIMVHGGCKSKGCFAMTDPVIEEIYLLMVQSFIKGAQYVPVHIFPFRMTTENLLAHGDSQWIPFWMNLKTGYNAFEKTRIPPKVGHHRGRYVIYPSYPSFVSASAEGDSSSY